MTQSTAWSASSGALAAGVSALQGATRQPWEQLVQYRRVLNELATADELQQFSPIPRSAMHAAHCPPRFPILAPISVGD